MTTKKTGNDNDNSNGNGNRNSNGRFPAGMTTEDTGSDNGDRVSLRRGAGW